MSTAPPARAGVQSQNRRAPAQDHWHGATLYLGDSFELTGGVWTKYLTAEAKRVGPTPGSSVTSWMPSFVSRLRAGATISPASAW